MYTIRKNKEYIRVINILVYAEDKNTLWEYRNTIEQLDQIVRKMNMPYKTKINPILTISYHTVLEMINVLPGGIDIYLSDSQIEESVIRFLDKKIQQQYPRCHVIIKEEEYLHSYYIDDRKKNEYWKADFDILKDELLTLVQEIQEAVE